MISRAALTLTLALGCNAAAAATLQALQAGDQLRLRSWLAPAEDIAVGQEVQLLIEVSTRRWFAGGTTIKPPEVPDLLILRRNQFATNLSRREDGSTWVVQQWQLELYPQRDGEFLVPPVTLALAVNDAEAGIVRGAMATQPLAFSARVPELLSSVDSWLAAPSLEISQSFDRELLGLAPGDAFTQVITLRATHLIALMLPTPEIPRLQGLAAYPDTPRLQDRSNRGEATAERVQKITWVVEQPGQYRLPEQAFHWWDTGAREVRTEMLPAVTIDAGVAAAAKPAQSEPQRQLTVHWTALPAALLLIVALLLRRRLGTPAPAANTLLRDARRALRKGEPASAARLLYRWLNLEQPQPDWLSLRSVFATRAGEPGDSAAGLLLQSVYADSAQAQANRIRLPRLTAARRRRAWLQWILPGPVNLALNPGDSAAEQKVSG